MFGGGAGDEAAQDAVAWGLDPDLFAPVEDTDSGIWDQHLPAFEAFLAVATQWRSASGMEGLKVIGLDYTAVKAGFDLAGIDCPPAVWADVRVIESAAMVAFNGGEDGV